MRDGIPLGKEYFVFLGQSKPGFSVCHVCNRRVKVNIVASFESDNAGSPPAGSLPQELFDETYTPIEEDNGQ